MLVGRAAVLVLLAVTAANCYSTSQETKENVPRQKIVYVTDTGVDDALGLMLFLRNQELVDVLSVVCTYGNTPLNNACSNVKRVLTLNNEKQIPLHRGSSTPLIKEQDSDPTHFNGKDGFGNVAKEYPTGGIREKDHSGVLALIELSKKHPRQITVVSVGPLTTLALAHRIDPELTERLKSIIFMGGNYKGIGNITPVSEYNFYMDPEAAHITVSEAKCKLICIPWETTLKHGLRKEVYNKLLQINTERGNFFKKITAHSSDINFNERGLQEHTVSDFLAATYFLYPSSGLREFENPMVVEYQSNVTKGLVILLRSSSDRLNVTIVTDFDQHFVDDLMKKMLMD